MTDATTPLPATTEPIFNKTWLGVITLMTLAFNAAIILWTTLAGTPGNTLHSSAQSWSYVFGGGILIGLGIGTMSTTLMDMVKK